MISAKVASAFTVLSALSACTGSANDFVFTAVIGGIGSNVDSVEFREGLVPIVDRRVTITTYFDSYSDGMSTGSLSILFRSGTTVLQEGTIAVGSCLECSPPLCPEPAKIEVEEVEYYDPSKVSPLTVECFTCTGDGRKIRACR